MAENLPYLVSPGSIKTALERIRNASVPERVNIDFISTKILIKGGTGKAIIPFLKKIGFVSADGVPTDLYKQFRNKSSGGSALAKGIKNGYSALSSANEYFYDLKDHELKNLIIQVSGLDKDNKVVSLIFSTLQNLKSMATFDAEESEELEQEIPVLPINYNETKEFKQEKTVGLNLSYTINLNLPATSDQSVFNAIFKSLRENLLKVE
ncbi:DUF5343 domain-containing protein [Asticcacaulis sp. SL142]|uniref:DUF5343 domain-containing protein n=1 Tax=Asticcacaulis sp. SL142 TaxID=2995155 RepID=UPI00226C7584|nr:DUF5343 domain-containing protein [Asticcacaulis sp. SL142]WAC47404.1 DUF5343 domain-containing protein [Asticcacaulis sp. SL142]